jgi:hypothetical protein
LRQGAKTPIEGVTHRTLRPGSTVLALACVALCMWQSTFALSSAQLDRTYRNAAASGIDQQQVLFVYFYYYLDLYPLTSIAVPQFQEFYSQHPEWFVLRPPALGLPPAEFNPTAAAALIREHPESLLNEVSHSYRAGDRGKIWLFMPGAFLKGVPYDIGVTWLMSCLFTLSLVSLLIAAWYINQFGLGVWLVLFIGSQPFQLYEVFNPGFGGQGQVFSMPITFSILALALHFPIIFDRDVPRWYWWSLPLVTGVLFGTARQVRTEIIVTLLSAALCYGLAWRRPWLARLGALALLMLSFWGTSQFWDGYFEAKFQQAYMVVNQAGGDPLRLRRASYHDLWGSVFSGLGDFDTKYGYEWNDHVVWSYTKPILSRMGVQELDALEPDSSGKYYQVIWSAPEFGEVARQKILSDIVHDPIWYLGILAKRACRILVEVTPARLALGARWVDLPLSGILLLPVLAGLLFLRRWSLSNCSCFPCRWR